MQVVGKRKKTEWKRDRKRERLGRTRPLCTAKFRRCCWTLASSRRATSTAPAEIQEAAGQLDSDAAGLCRWLPHCKSTKHGPCTWNNVWYGTKVVQCGSTPGNGGPSYWPKPLCMRSICSSSLLTQYKWIIHQSPFTSNQNEERSKEKFCAKKKKKISAVSCSQWLDLLKSWLLQSCCDDSEFGVCMCNEAHSPVRIWLLPPTVFKNMIPLSKFHLPIWASRIPLVIPL